MAITFTAAGTAATGTQGTGGNITPALPASPQDGDLLIVYNVSRDNSAHSMPSGWTQKFQASNGASTQVSIFYARYKGTSPDSAAGEVNAAGLVTHSGTGAIVGRMTGWRGVTRMGDPFSAISASLTATGTSISTAAITTADADAMILHFMGAGTANTANAFSALAGACQTSVYTSNTASNATGRACSGIYRSTSVQGAAGTTGTSGATASASPTTATGWAGVLAALIPESSTRRSSKATARDPNAPTPPVLDGYNSGTSAGGQTTHSITLSSTQASPLVIIFAQYDANDAATPTATLAGASATLLGTVQADGSMGMIAIWAIRASGVLSGATVAVTVANATTIWLAAQAWKDASGYGASITGHGAFNAINVSLTTLADHSQIAWAALVPTPNSYTGAGLSQQIASTVGSNVNTHGDLTGEATPAGAQTVGFTNSSSFGWALTAVEIQAVLPATEVTVRRSTKVQALGVGVPRRSTTTRQRTPGNDWDQRSSRVTPAHGPGAWYNVTPAGVDLSGSGTSYGCQTVGVDTANPGHVYAQFNGDGIYKSTDYGHSWSGPINTGTGGGAGNGDGGLTVIPSATSGQPPTIIQANIRANGVGSAIGVFRSTDGGVSFTEITPNLGTINGFNTASRKDWYQPRVNPYDRLHLLMDGHEMPGVLAQSTDGGDTWSAVPWSAAMITAAGGGGTGFSFFVDTGASGTTATTFLTILQDSAGTFRTANSGTSWTLVDGAGHPHGNCQMTQVGAGGVIYKCGAGSALGDGVYRSTDLGATWARVGSNSSRAVVFHTANRIYAMYGWAAGVVSVGNPIDVNPQLEWADQPGTGTWTQEDVPGWSGGVFTAPGMEQGPAQAAQVFDGTYNHVITASWLSGLWLYQEPQFVGTGRRSTTSTPNTTATTATARRSETAAAQATGTARRSETASGQATATGRRSGKAIGQAETTARRSTKGTPQATSTIRRSATTGTPNVVGGERRSTATATQATATPRRSTGITTQNQNAGRRASAATPAHVGSARRSTQAAANSVGVERRATTTQAQAGPTRRRSSTVAANQPAATTATERRASATSGQATGTARRSAGAQGQAVDATVRRAAKADGQATGTERRSATASTQATELRSRATTATAQAAGTTVATGQRAATAHGQATSTALRSSSAQAQSLDNVALRSTGTTPAAVGVWRRSGTTEASPVARRSTKVGLRFALNEGNYQDAIVLVQPATHYTLIKPSTEITLKTRS